LFARLAHSRNRWTDYAIVQHGRLLLLLQRQFNTLIITICYTNVVHTTKIQAHGHHIKTHDICLSACLRCVHMLWKNEWINVQFE